MAPTFVNKVSTVMEDGAKEFHRLVIVVWKQDIDGSGFFVAVRKLPVLESRAQDRFEHWRCICEDDRVNDDPLFFFSHDETDVSVNKSCLLIFSVCKRCATVRHDGNSC